MNFLKSSMSFWFWIRLPLASSTSGLAKLMLKMTQMTLLLLPMYRFLILINLMPIKPIFHFFPRYLARVSKKASKYLSFILQYFLYCFYSEKHLEVKEPTVIINIQQFCYIYVYNKKKVWIWWMRQTTGHHRFIEKLLFL